VKVGKVNVHENFDLASQFNINTIPRVYVFKGKQPVAQRVGFVAERDLVKLLDEVLSK
jgi:thioredoxin-like negative regulator of GroEL